MPIITRKPVFTLVSALVLFATATLVSAAAPKPYEASYTLEMNDGLLSVDAVKTLVKLDPNNYKISWNASHLLYSIEQTSVFEWVNGFPLSTSFEQTKGAIFSKKDYQVKLNWVDKRASFNNNGEQGTFQLKEGTLDELTAQLQLRLRLAAGEKLIEFNQIDKDEVETRKYKVVGEETLETVLGKTKTIKVDRIRKNKKRHTSTWYAPDYDYIVVKSIQTKTGGDSFSLALTSYNPDEGKPEATPEPDTKPTPGNQPVSTPGANPATLP